RRTRAGTGSGSRREAARYRGSPVARRPAGPWAASNQTWTPQVERHGVFQRAFLGRNFEIPGRVSLGLEPGEAARLRLVGVDRDGLVVAAAGMRHVIDAAAERAAVPAVIDVEGQRRMHV